mmetsp:Transcript_42135/g.75468  ORF Transcript_42135/g.75468 Transcript_42135/m.75468 type:complete len:285 (-) Transcript_42135:213-1067(-)
MKASPRESSHRISSSLTLRCNASYCLISSMNSSSHTASLVFCFTDVWKVWLPHFPTMYMSEVPPMSAVAIPLVCRIRIGRPWAHWSASIWMRILADSCRPSIMGIHIASPFRFKMSMPSTSALPDVWPSSSRRVRRSLSREPIKNLKCSSQMGFRMSFFSEVDFFSPRTFNSTKGEPVRSPSMPESAPAAPRITPITTLSVQSPKTCTAIRPTISPSKVIMGNQPSYGLVCKSNIVIKSIQLPMTESKVTPSSQRLIQIASAVSTPRREPPDSVITLPPFRVVS